MRVELISKEVPLEGRLGMNTTNLIGRWNMDGARGDLAGRFQSVADIRALVLGEERPPRVTGTKPLLMKRADEEDWRPLAGGAS